MKAITTETIDTFRAIRRKEPGKKPGSVVSPATLNNNLRQIKAALRKARKWGWIDSLPEFTLEKEPEPLPTFVAPGHFTLIYAACDIARLPNEVPYPPANWWRALLIMAHMTGWRISELLNLEWADVDFAAGTAVTRACRNKGKRDGLVALHPVVLDHLKPLQTFHTLVFPWEHNQRTLYTEFAKIQDEAGIHIPCANQRVHKCTPTCHHYGFHDERRSFATMNATNMSREALQTLMRHKSPLTTAKYIQMARDLIPAVANLHVPSIDKTSSVARKPSASVRIG